MATLSSFRIELMQHDCTGFELRAREAVEHLDPTFPAPSCYGGETRALRDSRFRGTNRRALGSLAANCTSRSRRGRFAPDDVAFADCRPVAECSRPARVPRSECS